ncbi:MAG: response regulator [Betaproteobacteria bacterium]|nr:response regulator [Betaproteobacteria bacterium]MBV9361259.1 response regulator [Betaproteobacteria bacterium]
MGNDRPDAQTSARLLKRALTIKGSREKLADSLGVHPHDLALWLAGKGSPPEAVFERVLEVVLDERAAPSAAPDADGRRRVLIADDPAGYAALALVLGNEFTLVPVYTLTEALDLLQNAAVARNRRIDAIVCGLHFEGSQMLRFLECVKAYRPTQAIPFIGCRALATALRDPSLAAMREACEALGAIAFIDLPELQSRAGAEKAAVEFREAVRAAVQMQAAAQRLRVLVVDDNADSAHMLTALLRMAGHEVHKAASGAAALRIGAQLKPDAAVLDIGLRDMSGHALAQEIRRAPWGADVTLIAVTGYGAPEDIERSRAAGFAHHLIKPVAVDVLLELLSRRAK